MRRLRGLWLAPLVLLALAAECVDQQQFILGSQSIASINGIPSIGVLPSIVAQTVTAGVSGDLVAVSLDVYDCDGTGTATLEIQATTNGLPNGTVLSSRTITPPVSDPGSLTKFQLPAPLPMGQGTVFAIILRPEPGDSLSCKLRVGPGGDSYPNGSGVVFNGPTFGWLPFPDGFPKDLAFQTWVDTP